MPGAPIVLIGKKYLEKVLPQIAAAKENIDIIIFEWRLYPTRPTHPITLFMRELQAASNRGVRIRCLVRSPLLADKLRQYGIEVKIHHSDKLLHAKMMLIDSRTAIVGSHNYTGSAFTSNLEISLIVFLSDHVNDLSNYFKNLWSV